MRGCGDRAASLLAAALAALQAGAAHGGAASERRCDRTAPAPPRLATGLNGVAWPELCAAAAAERAPEDREEHFFIIGDWGGIGVPPRPADDRAGKRAFVAGVDDRAQQLVAAQFNARAAVSKPEYVLNAGDNFYWGGVEVQCGENVSGWVATGQWRHIFEAIYDAPELQGKPWMGVLGNHDYGGYSFTRGWDQAVAYTWGPSGRWLTPALYWSRKVWHRDFSVDYYFVDSNMNDAFHPDTEPSHNMCSTMHNADVSTCGETGPTSTWDCFDWFHGLWREQIPWLEERLAKSTAEWQVVVTHFPPDFQGRVWQRLAREYGIDLIVAGHRHQQELHYQDNALGDTAWVVSGGGGGITSEGQPTKSGQDDMYGFMDVAIAKESMRIEMISHGGVVRRTQVVTPRLRASQLATSTSSTSTTTSSGAAREEAPGKGQGADGGEEGVGAPSHDDAVAGGGYVAGGEQISLDLPAAAAPPAQLQQEVSSGAWRGSAMGRLVISVAPLAAAAAAARLR